MTVLQAAPIAATPFPVFFAADGRDGAHIDGDEIFYRRLLDEIGHGFCIVEVLFDGAALPVDYRFLEVNATFEAQTGLADVVGRTMLSLCPDHERHWFELYGRVALTGEPARFERQAAALGRWYEVRAFRLDPPETRRVAILFRDITAQRQAEERARLLAAESDHRSRNMLAVVSSLVRLASAETVEEFRNDLLGRVRALASSQRLLSNGGSDGTSLLRLVADEMAAYCSDGRLNWSGPAVALDGRVAQTLALALHELATNAIKHGALSQPDGRVDIAWSHDADRRLALCWRESGGPPIAEPTRQGTGTTVVTMGIRDQLGGDVRFRWRRDGLVCDMVVPLRG